MERLDDLLLGGFQLWQDPEGVRFGIDAVLLGHFVAIKRGARYADLGTGTGAIVHITVARGAEHVVAFEIQERLAELTRRSVAHNGLTDRILVEEGDYRTAHERGYGGAFHAVMVNPPYFPEGQGKLSSQEAQQVARHGVLTSLTDVAESAKRLLRFGGQCYCIYRAEQLSTLLATWEAAQLAVKRLRFVHGRIDQPAKLVLVEAKYGGQPGLRVEPPLVLYKAPGVYTEEVSRWYEKG